MQVAHGLASGAIHPQEVLDAATPKTPDIAQPAEAQPSPSATSPATPAAPPVLGAQPATPRIASAAPATPAPAAPTPGSTEDLESRALARTTAPPPIATPSPMESRTAADQAELARVQSSGSGISQFQQRHPVLGTIARIGAGVGSALFPSIAANIPGTDYHHQAVLAQDRRAVGEDLGEQEKTAQIGEVGARAEQAETGAERNTADAAKLRADAAVAGNPKPPKTPQEVYANAVQAAVQAGRDPSTDPEVLKLADTITAIQKPAAQKAAHVTYDSGIPVSVTDKDGNVFDVNDPKLPAELKPLVQAATRAHGQHVKEDSDKQAAAFAQQEKMHNEKQDDLTAATKSMIEAAPGVLKLSARVRQLVDEQEKSLGPEAGRWNEFMTGKVGAPNPEFTKLRTDVGLLTTKLMRMHVGARGGEMMMSHFKDLIDSGKQSPENLRAALDEIDSYAKETASEKPGAEPAAGPEKKGTSDNDPLGIR
jgi:hypothetical protein